MALLLDYYNTFHNKSQGTRIMMATWACTSHTLITYLANIRYIDCPSSAVIWPRRAADCLVTFLGARSGASPVRAIIQFQRSFSASWGQVRSGQCMGAAQALLRAIRMNGLPLETSGKSGQQGRAGERTSEVTVRS